MKLNELSDERLLEIKMYLEQQLEKVKKEYLLRMAKMERELKYEGAKNKRGGSSQAQKT
jgi:hypothetical protein